MEVIKFRACTNADCEAFGKLGDGNIIKHAAFSTKQGASERCLCKICGATFSANTGTVYAGLRCSRDEFDQVVAMRVEGMSIAAIGRVMSRARSTIDRWLDRAAKAADQFNERHLHDIPVREIQADELCTFSGNKDNTVWLFTVIEVWSRLWISQTVGRRSYRNTAAVFNTVIRRGRIEGRVLATSDGFEFYQRVVKSVLGLAAIYGQVIKTRRNNRVIRVERSLTIGTKAQLAEALLESEDSETLNTSFVERLNLTIRQSLAYLGRRSPAHARCQKHLGDQVALIQCYYNFVRPHSGLKVGRRRRTPAMQAGLASRQLAFRDIFLAINVYLRASILILAVVTRCYVVHPTFCSPNNNSQRVKHHPSTNGGYFHSQHILELKLGMTIDFLEQGKWNKPAASTRAAIHELNALFEHRFEDELNFAQTQNY